MDLQYTQKRQHIVLLLGRGTNHAPNHAPIMHCKKRRFVSNRYNIIYLNQSNIEATQDIYLLQMEFVTAKHNFLSFQIVAITLNDMITIPNFYSVGFLVMVT